VTAARDFNTAIELGVRDGEAYFQRGTSRQADGDLPGALADYTEAIGIDPKAYLAYLNRGTVQQAMGDWDKALADYTQVVAGVPANADSASFYLWIAQKHQNSADTEADAALSKYLAARPAASQQDWHAEIGGFLLGQVAEADFLTAAAAPDPKIDTARHCEAWYYAGMKHLLAGDEAGAGDWFRKCAATEMKGRREYFLASAMLKTTMVDAPEPPSPPAPATASAPQP